MKKIVNAISIVGKDVSAVGTEMSKVIAKTGQKPKYIVMDSKQHDDILSTANVKMSSVKVKQGRILKYKGMSVIIVT